MLGLVQYHDSDYLLDLFSLYQWGENHILVNLLKTHLDMIINVKQSKWKYIYTFWFCLCLCTLFFRYCDIYKINTATVWLVSSLQPRH